MLPVTSESGPDAASGGPSGAVADTDAAEPDASTQPDTNLPSVPTEVDLLPPGPLHEVKLTPSPLRVECRGRRRARARPLDAKGKPVDAPVEFDWTLSRPIATLIHDDEPPGRVSLVAGDREGVATLVVTAREGNHEARAEVEVEVLEEIPAGRSNEGIPEPELVHHPGATWRSRMIDERWQVNAGHRDFRAVADRPVLKLRYLATLFAKEVVLRSHQDPRLAQPLEQLVEIASYADRKLTVRGRKKRKKS